MSKIQEFWESRRRVSGDPLALDALTVLNKEGFDGWVADRLLIGGHLLAHGTLPSEEFVRELSIDVMDAHIEATDKSVGLEHGGLLAHDEIDEYHREVFEDHGLPRAAYGGWWTPGSYYCSGCRPAPLLDSDPLWENGYCRGCPP